MESEEVLQSLERIRTMVLDLTTPDVYIQMVDKKVMITLELCEQLLKEAQHEMKYGKTRSSD